MTEADFFPGHFHSVAIPADAGDAATRLRKVIDQVSTHVHDISTSDGIVTLQLHPSDAISLALLAEAGLK